MATRTFTAPPATGSATESWSRSRESSLSIDAQGRPRRSRIAALEAAAACVIPWVSAMTADEKSGSSPRWSMAACAMPWSCSLPVLSRVAIGCSVDIRALLCSARAKCPVMPAALDVRDLEKRFGAVDALRGVTFSVEPGEVFGYLGPNGSGKTTTLRIVLGLVRESAGSARLFGKPPADPASRADIGFLPGD